MAKALNTEDAGTLEELCKRISRFAEHPEQVDAFKTYEGEIGAQGAIPRLTAPTSANVEFRTSTAAEMAFSYDGKTINQIRKWGCHFDGRDPAAFLERVGVLRQAYGFTTAQLLQGLPEPPAKRRHAVVVHKLSGLMGNVKRIRTRLPETIFASTIRGHIASRNYGATPTIDGKICTVRHDNEDTDASGRRIFTRRVTRYYLREYEPCL